jgi:hypothetical protein
VATYIVFKSVFLFLKLIESIKFHSNFEIKFVRQQTNMFVHVVSATVTWVSHRAIDIFHPCINNYLINDELNLFV